MMDNALMVSMLGKDLSRPFVQSLHAFKSAGQLLVSFLMSEFVPKSESESEAICKNLQEPSEESLEIYESASETFDEKFNALLMPFVIVSAWITISGKVVRSPREEASQTKIS